MSTASKTAAAKRLVVCGGSGFLGSRICKHAVARGWDVTSLRWDTVTASADAPSWAHKVSWERADLLRPATYAPLLKGADYVVHSMGILFEADYKGIVSGREPPIAGLRRLFASPGADPLARAPGDDTKPPDADAGPSPLSYEAVNRDSAVALARHAADERAAAFCYISACSGAPILPARYISTKREAESAIASGFPRMRSLFFRPGFMYDGSRKLTMGLAAMAGAGSVFNGLTGNYLKGFMGAAVTKPLRADLVAEAVVEALSDEAVQGPVDVEEMEELANKAWRKGML